MKVRALHMLVLVTAFFMLNGCLSPRITLEVASQPNVNPDSSGRP